MTEKDVVYALGIPGSYRGHHCLVVGAELAARNPNIIFRATTALYPEIAQIVGSTPKRVERNIRTAIKACWDDGNREFLNQIAGCPLSKRPKPIELIDMIAAYLERENAKSMV